jgi:pilus assembly protein FimV
MKRTKLPADRVVGTSTDKQRPWRLHAVALAAAVLLSLPSPPAQALALGRVTVQSALGEPLRADVDLPEITPDEVATLRATVASPEAFRAAGMEYSSALAGVRVTLERRPDGRYFLRLASDRPVNDPFVDLILETSWASGRIVRDFTMLFDPPALRQGQTPLTAQVGPSGQPGAATAPVAPRGQRSATAPTPPARAPARAASPAPAPAAAAPAPAGEGGQVTVQAGDTAGKIAAANKPATVSLDQMLVAMLRSNPEAFAGGNVNRLRAGAVLSLPSEEQAQAVSATEARQTLVAQSRDFNEFRRRLAEGVATAPAAGTQRETRGQVQAQVDEKRPAAAAPDKLTLSKGAVQGRAGAEDRIARERAAQEANTRVAELNRNLGELNRLSSAAPAAGASAPRGAASAPAAGSAAAAARPASSPAVPGVSIPGQGAAVQSPAPAAAQAAAPATQPASAAAPAMAAAATTAASAPGAASAPAAAASAPVGSASAPAGAASAPAVAAAPAGEASAPAAAASAPSPMVAADAAATPASTAAPKRPAPAPAPVEDPSLVDQLLENPLIPAAVGGALVLLLGLGAYRMRQRRKATQVDSSFLESRLQPDSFFGASGGQRVDTADAAPTGSSMVYSPSQLDAAGDVDPVAEADVYLAYGRDLQAEEILKEALRINPQRVAIHTKLLEIYAKRRDTKAFEQVASEAFSLTHGLGPEWARICELGQDIDPANPMYQPGGQPGEGGAVAAGAAAAAATAASFLATSKQVATEPQALAPAADPAPAPASGAGGVDLDLDLDFSLGDDDGAPARAPAASASPAAVLDPDATLMPGAFATAPSPAPAAGMDFNVPAAPGQPEPAHLDVPDLALNDNSLNFSAEPINPTAAPVAAPTPAAAAPAADPGMIEFDLGSLSLDLDKPAAAQAPAASASESESPSTTGLSLDVASGDDDPLATKLALAQEFNAIGDADGARSLAQEVIAEASGDLKSRAQKFLAEIG